MIRLEKICKKFDNDLVVKDFDIEINKGDFIAFIGPSGAGKTTILNIIGLLEKPTTGTIFFNNKKINYNKVTNILRNEISYLFQGFALIDNETVKENLKLALTYVNDSKKNKDKMIKNAIEKVGLKDYENKKIYKLSGGEQQRVAIARLFLKPSNIILADEPTGSLDNENKIIVMNYLKELNESGKTIILVTHDLDLIEYATRTIKIGHRDKKEN